MLYLVVIILHFLSWLGIKVGEIDLLLAFVLTSGVFVIIKLPSPTNFAQLAGGRILPLHLIYTPEYDELYDAPLVYIIAEEYPKIPSYHPFKGLSNCVYQDVPKLE